MKKIHLNLAPFLLIWFITFNIVAYGQVEPPTPPYKIEIGKNIKTIKSINISTLGKKLQYIPLETSPNCLIQDIYHVKLSESYIFIHDYDRILQFDRSGKFIRQIGSTGRGPQEYYNIHDLCVNEQKKEIYIISSPKLLSVFDFNGVFKNSYNLSHRIIQIIIRGDNNLMFHMANEPGVDNPSWIITNRNGITLTSMKNTLKRNSNPGFVVLGSPLYLFKNEVHFMEFGIDTLYYFHDNQRTPYAIFSFGDVKMNPDPLITQSMVKNREMLTDKLWPLKILENDTFLFIKLSHGMTNGYSCAIFNKNTNAVTFLKEDTFVNDLYGGIPFWPKEIVNDKILIDHVDAFDLLKHIVPTDLRKKISETSNPILMILEP